MRPNFQQPKEMDTLQEIRSLRGKRCCRWGHGLRSNLQIAPFPACVTVARVVRTISAKTAMASFETESELKKENLFIPSSEIYHQLHPPLSSFCFSCCCPCLLLGSSIVNRFSFDLLQGKYDLQSKEIPDSVLVVILENMAATSACSPSHCV
jgi:hypothetical protein